MARLSVARLHKKVQLTKDTYMETLIIGSGHGVPKAGCTALPEILDDASWSGGFSGEGREYFRHIEAAVRTAATKPDSQIIFSGGQTREEAGKRSEAFGYWEVARDNGWFGHPEIGKHALKEEFARDSLENLIFSLLLFYQAHRKWPENIVVVGWIFKEERYNFHRQAIKWPATRFEYVGVNNPEGKAMEVAWSGEQRKLEAVRCDPFLSGAEWAGQRELRNPFQRFHPYRGLDSATDTLLDLMDTHALKAKFPWVG